MASTAELPLLSQTFISVLLSFSLGAEQELDLNL
jgi:hypothetical protein